MEKTDRKKAVNEWNQILKDHPHFARAFLAQQAILIEASELGHKVVDRGMCRLLEIGFPVIFEDYWISRCKERIHKEIEIGGIIGCLSQTNRDPARCFGNEDPEGWFDDPLAGGCTLPPKPPDPHFE